jgi:hypothetical protein
MKISRFFLSLAAIVALNATAPATTVIPPSFDQLVGQAQVIFQGSVTNVRSQWAGEGANRHIESYISFRVEESLKGTPGESYVMRVYGGTVGEDSMGIADAPEFKVGDHDILFVENNGSQAIPLVGIMHGRFHLLRDSSGTEVVTKNEGQPVKNVERLGTVAEESEAENSFEPTMTTEAFKAAVRTKLQQLNQAP